MVKTCPHCGLVNPPQAQRCDCGYDFTIRFAANARKPSVFLLVISAVVLLAGVGLLALGAIMPITTPEDELTEAEGAATEVSESSHRSRQGSETFFLKFSVGGYRTEYASDAPGYEQVRAAVLSEQPVRVWVSTKQETLFPRQGWVPLYKMKVGDRVVLTYQEVIAHQESRGGGFYCSGVLILAGAVGLGSWLRSYRRYRLSVQGPVA